MDITNSTDVATQYKVTGTGGTPMGPYHVHEFRAEDAVDWPVLQAGSKISYSPRSSGPWTIYFMVNGKGIAVTTQSQNDHLTLTRTGDGFHVKVN